jgi:hypothetical protein
MTLRSDAMCPGVPEAYLLAAPLFGYSHLICKGPEHSGADAQPSYCTLPMFHPDKGANDPVDGLGYISNDGHMFSCRNPVVLQQAFHV